MKLFHYKVITSNVEVGDSKLFRIRLNPAYKNDKGVIAHEMTHVLQWYVSLLYVAALVIALAMAGYYSAMVYAAILGLAAHNLLSTVSRSYRKHIEAEAFAAQLDVIGWKYLESLAESLAENYDLRITKKEAMDLIGSKA